MGRFRESTTDDSETAIDISPLIDCVFILLIFFIVTTTFIEESGIEVDKPQAAAQIQSEKTSVVITLSEKGVVTYEGNEIGVGGIQPIVKQMLEREDVPVIIQAEETAKSGMLMRLVDEAKLGGAQKVSITTSNAGN
ncbi:MAG: ExbD/TolR family protein [Candidatus Sumerlaeia bacterium]